MSTKDELSHFGIPGMRWGHRRGNVKAATQQRSGTRKFQLASLTKDANGRKEIGKAVVDALMTPAWSKTKWTDMNPKQKKVAIAVTAAAIAASGALLMSELRTMRG